MASPAGVYSPAGRVTTRLCIIDWVVILPPEFILITVIAPSLNQSFHYVKTRVNQPAGCHLKHP